MTGWQMPRPRKGFTIVGVVWNQDGTVRQADYAPITKARPDRPAVASEPISRRGLRAGQCDLFATD